MKTLKYVPIYKGNYNMTPLDYEEEIDDFEEEPDIIIEYSSWMELLAVVLCCGYLLLSIVR